MRLSADKHDSRSGRIFAAAFVISASLAAGALAWAQTAPPPSPDAPDLGAPIFKAVTQQLVAPVLVTDHDGNIIDGLKPNQFHLFDNGKEQNISVDSTLQPISLVVAIEKSARVEGILPQLRKLGTLLTQITGRSGEAAILAFDSRLDVVQDFTTDNDKIKVAINNLHAGSSGTRVVDAVERSIYMLEKRPKSNRHMVLLVSETRDEGSQARLKETLMMATLTNVIVYDVDISQLAVRFNEKQDAPRPSAIDVASQNFPMGIASTPTTVEQEYGMGNRAQFVPLLKEIFIDTKGIFVRNQSTQFARATGGAEFEFLRQRGLEDAVMKISQQVHSQYLVSYKPTNADEVGYHTIVVQIDRSPEYICKTRPGYWIGGAQ